MDEDVLADCIQRLGRPVSGFPQTSGIDFYPVKGTGEELSVVDARIILENFIDKKQSLEKVISEK